MDYNSSRLTNLRKSLYDFILEAGRKGPEHDHSRQGKDGASVLFLVSKHSHIN